MMPDRISYFNFFVFFVCWLQCEPFTAFIASALVSEFDKDRGWHCNLPWLLWVQSGPKLIWCRWSWATNNVHKLECSSASHACENRSSFLQIGCAKCALQLTGCRVQWDCNRKCFHFATVLSHQLVSKCRWQVTYHSYEHKLTSSCCIIWICLHAT